MKFAGSTFGPLQVNSSLRIHWSTESLARINSREKTQQYWHRTIILAFVSPLPARTNTLPVWDLQSREGKGIFQGSCRYRSKTLLRFDLKVCNPYNRIDISEYSDERPKPLKSYEGVTRADEYISCFNYLFYCTA